MITVNLPKTADFELWRGHARRLLQERVPPSNIIWQSGESPQADFFANAGGIDFVNQSQKFFTVPRAFAEQADYACRHASIDRFALLYRILWRLCHDGKNILAYKTDADILKFTAYVKAVRRDAYKIKAFLRFREARRGDDEVYIAWYEPEHYSLPLSLPFFQTRFKNMAWSILTPYLAAHWNREILSLQENPDPSLAPREDKVEEYWLKYYASTFNPARPKKSAILSQMPKKYWKNMPETALIRDMLRTSNSRIRQMIADSNSQ